MKVRLLPKRCSIFHSGRRAALGIFAVLAVTAHPKPSVAAAPAKPISLTAVDFVSQTTGWGTTGTAVVHTTDSGATWHIVTPLGLSLTTTTFPATDFLDGGHAWVADAYQSASPGVFRTVDGGRTWQHATLPAPSRSAGPVGIVQLDIVDNQHGWALEALGGGAGTFYFALYRTTDGGVHWDLAAGGNLQRPPTHGGYPTNVQAIHFTSPQIGWTSVVIFAGPQLSGVYRTMDGGRTWTKVPLPMTGVFAAGFFGVVPPTFFDAKHGAMLVATDKTLGVYSTADGGTRWLATAPLMVNLEMATAHPYVVDFVDSTHIWVIAAGHLYRTSDLGRHWLLVRQSLGFGATASIDYVEAAHGWALGGSPSHTVLRRTVNGGRNWTILSPVLI